MQKFSRFLGEADMDGRETLMDSDAHDPEPTLSDCSRDLWHLTKRDSRHRQRDLMAYLRNE